MTDTNTGTNTTSWLESLPDELRADPTLANVKDVPTLAKSYLDSQRYIGSAIRIPGEDAGAEDWAKFDERLAKVPGITRLPKEGESWDGVYAKLGRPESPDKYQVQRAEGIARDEAAEKSFLADAHKHGLTNSQAQAVLGYFDGMVSKAQQSRQAEAQQHAETLKAEWGAAFEAKLQASARAAMQYGGDELMQVLDSSGLGNHPAVIRAFAKMGESLKEGTSAGQQAGGFLMTPSEARDKINEIMNNREHAYHHGKAFGHADAVAKMQELFKYGYPEAA